jgi:hypothetical protein
MRCARLRPKSRKRDSQLHARFEECACSVSEFDIAKVRGTRRDILARWARSITAAMSSFAATIEPPAQRAKVMSKKYADSSGLCVAPCSCRGSSTALAVNVGDHGVIVVFSSISPCCPLGRGIELLALSESPSQELRNSCSSFRSRRRSQHRQKDGLPSLLYALRGLVSSLRLRLR